MGGRREISRSLTNCPCWKPIPLEQRMGLLPPFRYMHAGQAHMYCGMDFFGPTYVFHPETGSNREVKTFTLVISCLYTRNITGILLRSCSTADVILALRKFVSFRGAFKVMYCDRAKAFTKTNRELKKILIDIKWSEVRREFDRFGSEFAFGTEYASHTCGINEICVKAVKEGLKRAIGTSCLDFHELDVVISEVCAIANERPLGYITDSNSKMGEDIQITPSLLAIGRSVDIFPVNTEVNFNKTVQKIYKERRHMVNKFWAAYSAVYFSLLTFTPKWRNSIKFDLPIDTYVLLREKNMKNFHYLHGRITKVFRGRDNLIRNVELVTPQHKSPIIRHINHLSLLEHDYLRLQKEHPCVQHTCALYKKAG